MKSFRFFAMALFIIASLITIIIGCKYEVAEPSWYSPQPISENVSITGVTPTQALAGDNFIIINGTNLKGALDSIRIKKYSYYTDSLTHAKDSSLVYDSTFVHNGIYFNSVQATVLEATSTMIKVLRPDIVSDSCVIKIASDKSTAIVKFGPYKITAVKEPFGNFTTNVPLHAIALDAVGNMYIADEIITVPVSSSNPTNYLYNLWKVTPSGQKILKGYLGGETPLAQLTKQVSLSEARVSPLDGNLYYLQTGTQNSKDVHMVDLNTVPLKDSLWFKQIATRISFGDFDDNGYFYTGGLKSGIVVIRPDHSFRIESSYYAADTILSMRVFNHYVYVATRSGIWRNSVSDTGHVGASEPVLNYLSTAFASLPLNSISLSADGSKLYIGTNSKNPILIADATSLPIPPNTVDILYKGILPTYCKQLCFGTNVANDDGLYMISGNTPTTSPTSPPAVNWTVYKIHTGTTGAPYY